MIRFGAFALATWGLSIAAGAETNMSDGVLPDGAAQESTATRSPDGGAIEGTRSLSFGDASNDRARSCTCTFEGILPLSCGCGPEGDRCFSGSRAEYEASRRCESGPDVRGLNVRNTGCGKVEYEERHDYNGGSLTFDLASDRVIAMMYGDDTDPPCRYGSPIGACPVIESCILCRRAIIPGEVVSDLLPDCPPPLRGRATPGSRAPFTLSASRQQQRSLLERSSGTTAIAAQSAGGPVRSC